MKASESDVFVTDKARSKSDRYLSESELKDTVLNGEYEIYQETSPYNPEMYEDNLYILRGRFDGHRLDIVVEIDGASMVVITQKGYHGATYEGSEFYEHIGESIRHCLERHIS